MIEILRQRRSIRAFQDKPVEPEKKALLIEALLRSPSSRNFQPWEFILVEDRQQLKKMAEAKAHGADFVGKVPLAVVVLANPEKSDVWVEDCSIASIILQLEAQALGLASCWCQIRLRDKEEGVSSEAYLKQLLQVPEHLRVESVIGIGYSAESKQGHTSDTLLKERISYNLYGLKL
ncbi:MAG: NAD(P)H-dependent dehydrogenase/reductase [Desulfuromonas sp.]|nr:MAG: NAD(P)H-dependent dehydrogenase/reductase [Desulfuromonas sp.]